MIINQYLRQMNELDIPRGEYKFAQVTMNQYVHVDGKVICNVVKRFKKETEAVGVLIVDAGNTAQKCGLLPSDLLQQRDRCLMTLNNCRETIEMLQREIPGEQIVLRHEMASRLNDIEAAIKSTEL